MLKECWSREGDGRNANTGWVIIDTEYSFNFDVTTGFEISSSQLVRTLLKPLWGNNLIGLKNSWFENQRNLEPFAIWTGENQDYDFYKIKVLSSFWDWIKFWKISCSAVSFGFIFCCINQLIVHVYSTNTTFWNSMPMWTIRITFYFV